MKRFVVQALFILIVSTTAEAGYFSSNYDRQGSVAVSVEIEGKGLFNLVVSATFLSKPYDRSPYTSDAYESLISRLNVQWKDVAIVKILESSSYKLSDLSSLKASITEEIEKVVDKAKIAHRVDSKAEVVFSINGFYLVNLDDE